MDKLRIKGGNRLQGRVRISGAKNSALPAMAASLLTDDEIVLENLPLVNDIFTTRRLLRELGVAVELGEHGARLRAEDVISYEAPLANPEVANLRKCSTRRGRKSRAQVLRR